jgi:hypothetical protein
MHAVTNVEADGVYFRDGASSKVLAGDAVKFIGWRYVLYLFFYFML